MPLMSETITMMKVMLLMMMMMLMPMTMPTAICPSLGLTALLFAQLL